MDNEKNFKIIELKNLKWVKTGNKQFCTNRFGVIDEFLTKLINPKKLSNDEWYKENKIEEDVFNIEYDGQIYYNYTLSNGRAIKVIK